MTHNFPWSLIGIAALVLAAIVAGARMLGNTAGRRMDAAQGYFHALAMRWPLQTASFYQRPFAFGEIDGCWFVFTWYYEQEFGQAPAPKLAIYTALPATRDLELQLALPALSDQPLRSLAWQEAGRGLYVGKRAKIDMQEQLALAACLSDASLAAMREGSVFPRAATIVSHWLKTMFGHEAELVLSGRDAARAAGLWLQNILPLGPDTAAAAAAVHAMASLAPTLASELSAYAAEASVALPPRPSIGGGNKVQ